MKITVIGATGLIGSKVVALLADAGHDRGRGVPPIGADVLTGEGLARCAARRRRPGRPDQFAVVRGRPGDGVLHDVDDQSGEGGQAAGVGHYVALSIVGVDGLPESGYMRAKVVQENDRAGIGAAVHDRARHAVP